MQQVLWVGAGGFLGAVLRFGVSACLPSDRFGAGTLFVNTLGCFVIGAVAAWVGARGELDPQTRGLLIVGVLGSFTTFSAFGDEVVELAQVGRHFAAAGIVAAHLCLGFGAVVAGRALALFALR